MKVDLYYQRQKCSTVTLLSGDIRFMRIFMAIPWGGMADMHAIAEKMRLSEPTTKI